MFLYILKPNFEISSQRQKSKDLHLWKKTVSLKTLITSLSFFVSDLKYQMKVLLVELHQSYSWSQDRRSMEYSLENQIAIDLYPWVKTRIALSLKFYLDYKILLHYINSIFRENISAEFWSMQSSIGNVKRDICHVTRQHKWQVKYNVL